MIVATADDLFYRRGFDHTSFADIATAVGISRGNFYHHFKSKDDILEAVILKRLTDRTGMTARWERQAPDPAGRIESFIDLLLVAHPAQPDAVRLFTLFREWLAGQFTALGRVETADQLALELLSRSQGAATLYNAFQDRDFLEREVAAMKFWLRDIATAETAHSPLH